MDDLIYPEWKKVIWRFVRVFISAFLVSGSVVLANTTPETLSTWDNFRNMLIVPFLLAGGIAGINAVGKLIRDLFGNEAKDSLIDKLLF